MGENVKRAKVADADVIQPYGKPMKKQAGFKVLKGNLFDSAIMKTSVISDDFRKRFLSNPKDQNAFEGRAVVFDGPEDYHHRIDDPSLKIDERTILFMRGVGADRLSGLGRGGEHAAAGGADQKRHHVAALHRRRPAVRHLGLAVDPECLAGGGGRRRAGAAENRRPRAHRSQQGHRGHSDFKRRTGEAAQGAGKAGGYKYPASQTPWQEIQRGMVDQLADGMVLKPAVKYQRVAQTSVPRDNH